MTLSRVFGGSRLAAPVLLALLALPLLLPCRAGAEAIDARAKPLVDLDAAALPGGPVSSWANGGGSPAVTLSSEGQPPAAAERDGRRAVWFDGAGPLRSAAAVPEEMVGSKPFTIAAVVYLPESAKRQVIVSWASRPNGTAEFSSGNGDDGAFFGWDRRLRFPRPPRPAAWHHLAWVYDQAEMRVYVDGDLDAQSPGKLTIKPGGRLIVGAGWDAAGKKPIFPFTGGVARVRIWARALLHREVRADAGLTRAFAVDPADGATPPAEGLTLRWQVGSDRAAAYDVRWAATREALASAPPRRVEATEFRPDPPAPGTRVYWRVDQLDSAGKVIEPGDVWTFATDNGPAVSPAPRDHVANVPRATAALHWRPGRYSTGQKLYWGTDANAVGKGTSSPVALDAKADAFALPPGGLEYDTTYYWRVEEANGPLPAARGEVWAFRTLDKITPDDVTFFVTSDTHYGFGNNADLNRKVIDQMNWLPGTPMPEKAGGGVVRTPRGVVLDGDLLDKGFDPKTAPALWREFVADYGLSGSDGRLVYPLYEGFGNHDGMTGKSVSRAGVRERNKSRVGLTAVSPEGFHYAWDWDQVHLVQLNLFPGADSADCITGPADHHPEHALQFLKDDLAKHVGDPGKVVVVFCHYCYSGGMADWWTPAAKDRFREAVKGYRVILIHGHSHGAYFYEWKGLRAISDGAAARPEGQTGDFLVVRITKDQLFVAQRKLEGWGITLHEPLPAADRTAADAQADGAAPATLTPPTAVPSTAPATRPLPDDGKAARTITDVPVVKIDPPDRGFYAKRLDYRGLPIKGAAVVSDAAFHEAWRRLDRLLRDNPVILQNLLAARAEVHLIGKDQAQTDLPEFLAQKGVPLKENPRITLDERARGMGGRDCSCGEENLLKLPGDRYRGRDILSHEFTHTIHGYGLSPNVRERITNTYKAARQKKLWETPDGKPVYGGTNEFEYLAELALWYVGGRGDWPRGMPPMKPGPEFIKAYDSEGYQLVDDLFSGRADVRPLIPRPRRPARAPGE